MRLPKHKWPKSWSSMQDPVVLLEPNPVGASSGRIIVEKAIRESSTGTRYTVWNKAGMFFAKPRKKAILVCVCGRHERDWKQNIDPCRKVLVKEVELGEPTFFLDQGYLGCTQRRCETSKDIVAKYRNMFESWISEGAKEKQPCSGKLDADISSGSHGLEGHAMKCVALFCKLANKTTLRSRGRAVSVEGLSR